MKACSTCGGTKKTQTGCKPCHGQGRVRGAKGLWSTCNACGGVGVINHRCGGCGGSGVQR